jgi:superfamily I DNA/RNA helicase
MQGCRNFSFFEISNYHQFFNTQVNNTSQDILELIDHYGLDRIYSSDVFDGQEPNKYHTILIDEIQDYQSEWVKIIRDNFLSEKGEMVLFGDESQNIYQREVGRSRVIAQGFGTWVKLSRSYRTDIDSLLNQLFKDFQLEFLVEKYTDTEMFEVSPTQMGIGFSLLSYESLSMASWQEDVFNSIQSYIKNHKLHPNDIVILCSKIGLLRQLNNFWVDKEKTHCMFETYDELSVVTNQSADELMKLDDARIDDVVRNNKEDVEKIRRIKKNHFYANSGLIKFSTIHSFKGLESKTVFYIMRNEDDSEIVYTSVTRSSENLVVYDLDGKNSCSEFFQRNIA